MLIVRDAASVYRAIEKIAATPGKNDKIAMVKEAMGQSKLFVRAIKAALDPFITYGIAALPARPDAAPGANTLDEETWWEMLEQLATRKLSGNAARDAVARALAFLTPESGELLRRIIKKDLRAGFSEETVNKAVKGTLPAFPYMRCSLPKDSYIEKWNWGAGIVVQEKADGEFANINHEVGGIVTITSRQGRPMDLGQLGALVDDILNALPAGTQTHGELVVYRDGQPLPRQESNGIMNSIAQGGDRPLGHEIRYLAWDQIPLSAVVAKGKHEVPYRERLKALLVGITGYKGGTSTVRLVPTKIVHSKAEALAIYSTYLSQGKEGAVIKHPLAIWKDGTSKDQVKFKLEVVVDLRVKGFVEGTGKYAGMLGAFEMESECGLLKTNVNGRGDDMRAAVWADRADWLDSVLAVRANSIMPPRKEGDPHSLFLPVMVERRTDKSEADTLQRVREQFEAAVAA
jgi:DNA ligase-1